MIIDGQHYQSICYDEAKDEVHIIDQTRLPHRFETLTLNSLDQVCHAIAAMQLRGAPLIGVAAAYGMYLALKTDPTQQAQAHARLLATRPTAVNLQWALSRVTAALQGISSEQKAAAALQLARQMEAEDIATCAAIGAAGVSVLRDLWQAKANQDLPLNVLTHCNAGALATVDWGTALAVVYKAAAAGIPLHVWVDETRPRNQGAALTCWELGQQGIAYTLIVDNAGGHLMQQGQVDVCIVGSDRTASNGDVCNKIGTYLKALAANDNNIPFYVALPVSTIDFAIVDGLSQIPIEEREAQEVSHLQGIDATGELRSVRIAPEDAALSNYGFDVTPARLVTGLITEQGVVAATAAGIASLKPAHQGSSE
jgi:methylthioribose-1-phosphate isomerase